MVKWEYWSVCLMIKSEGNDERIVQINNTVLHRPQTLDDYLNEAGANGWELIMRDANLYIFKRPRT